MQKVFISYCREDKAAARKLYGRLCAFGVDAWLDEKKVTPGQVWSYEIGKAIDASDYFLALVSNKSLAKTGHVQRQIKQARYIQDSLPEGKVFIIPCKLEECELPPALATLHWIKCFPNFGRACRRIAKAVGATEIPAEPVSRKSATSNRSIRRNLTMPPDLARRIEELKRTRGYNSDADIVSEALSFYVAAVTEVEEAKTHDRLDDSWLNRLNRMLLVAA
jgi:hypothetical protein